MRNRGTHKHKCSDCGHIWEHTEAAASNKAEHTCRVCGKVEWWKYLPDEEPVPESVKGFYEALSDLAEALGVS